MNAWGVGRLSISRYGDMIIHSPSLTPFPPIPPSFFRLLGKGIPFIALIFRHSHTSTSFHLPNSFLLHMHPPPLFSSMQYLVLVFHLHQLSWSCLQLPMVSNHYIHIPGIPKGNEIKERKTESRKKSQTNIIKRHESTTIT